MVLLVFLGPRQDVADALHDLPEPKLFGRLPELFAIEARLVDLLPIVRGYVYHPAFGGSFSLKTVVPALVPGFGYEDERSLRDFSRLAARAVRSRGRGRPNVAVDLLSRTPLHEFPSQPLVTIVVVVMLLGFVEAIAVFVPMVVAVGMWWLVDRSDEHTPEQKKRRPGPRAAEGASAFRADLELVDRA